MLIGVCLQKVIVDKLIHTNTLNTHSHTHT